MSIDLDARAATLATYDRRTALAGQWTMIAGLILSLAGPIYLVFFSGTVDVTSGQLWAALLAVAAAFAAVWIVEPLTYFPILGRAAMYQAFMIGNISSKLLPCALVAQDRIGAKAGTRRGDFAAVAAICGAATVHLASLFIFVGLLGTWLVGQLSPEIIIVVRTFVLPAVLGAVIVQAVISMKQPKIALIACSPPSSSSSASRRSSPASPSTPPRSPCCSRCSSPGSPATATTRPATRPSSSPDLLAAHRATPPVSWQPHP